MALQPVEFGPDTDRADLVRRCLFAVSAQLMLGESSSSSCASNCLSWLVSSFDAILL